MLRKKKEDVYKRQYAIQLWAFNAFVDGKITDEEYSMLVVDSMGTLKLIGGDKFVGRAREDLDKTIKGEKS